MRTNEYLEETEENSEESLSESEIIDSVFADWYYDPDGEDREEWDGIDL